MSFVERVLCVGLCLCASAASAQAGAVFTLTSHFEIEDPKVGDNAVLVFEVLGLDNGQGAVTGAVLKLEATALTLGLSAQVVVNDVSTHVDIISGAVALPVLEATSHVTIRVGAQVLAPATSITAHVLSAGSESLGEGSTAQLSAKVPLLALGGTDSLPATTVGATLTLALSISAPAIPYTYAESRLLIVAPGLSITGVSTSAKPLKASGEAFLLPSQNGDTTITLEVSALVKAADTSFEAVVLNPKGEKLSNKHGFKIGAQLPFLSLATLTDGEIKQLGSRTQISVTLTAPDVSYSYPALRLRTTLNGIAVSRATIGTTTLSTDADLAYLLPSIKGGEAISVTLEAQVTERSASIEAFVVDETGSPFSASSTATLSADRVTVNAGCAAASGTSLGWLVGLLVVARRWRIAAWRSRRAPQRE